MMKRRTSLTFQFSLFLFLIPLLGHALPAPLAEFTTSRRIRVRVAEAVPSVLIRGTDLKIHETASARRLASAPEHTSEWELRCQNGRIRAVSTQGARALDLKAPISLHTPAGFLSYRGRPYREELQVHSVGSLCEVVNELNLEKYLDGLINSEFNSRWNEEAMGAQVIAARTYAVHQILAARKNGRHFDLDATVSDQVYDGSVKEDYRSSRSVDRTRGLLLMVGSEESPLPIKAFYHSTCAGKTELPEHVWGMSVPGFKRSVHCPYCVRSPSLNWSTSYTDRELEGAIRRGAEQEGSQAGWPRDWKQVVTHGAIRGVRVGTWSSEGRVADVVTLWKTGRPNEAETIRELRIPGARFRNWLGNTRVRSTAFQLQADTAGTRWYLQGKGNGHGVGMCQWGAKTMGEKRFTTAQILRHYYPDAVLRKLW